MADAAARLDGAETPTVVRRRAANEKPRRVDARRGASAPGQQARTSVATLALAAAVSLASRLRAAPCAPAGASLGPTSCLLYTSDAADDLLCVDLGGRRIITKKTN